MFSKPGRAKIGTNASEIVNWAKIRHKAVMLSALQLWDPFGDRNVDILDIKGCFQRQMFPEGSHMYRFHFPAAVSCPQCHIFAPWLILTQGGNLLF